MAIDEDGRPDFSLLQTKLGQPGVAGLVYQAFDLLYLDGRSLLDVPLEDRKRLLRSVLKDHPRVRFAAHVVGEGKAFYEAAKANRLEGIIAKLRRSRYEPGRRSNAWLKFKVRPEQELVIGGWTPGEGNARDLGALAVGYYEDGKLRFAGKVGAGFTGATRKELLSKLKPLVIDDPPFDPPPPKDYKGRWGGDLGAVTWVQPELVMRAELGGWTRDGVVRQAAYKGLELGRDPTTVRRETAVATTSAVRAAEAETGDARAADARRHADRRRRMPPKSSKEDRRRQRGHRKRRPKAKAPPRRRPPADVPDDWRVTDDELAALDALGKEGVWQVGGDELKLTNLDKPLFEPREPDGGGPITKRELIRYFARIAPTMLRHLTDRPLNLQRFPNGAGAPGFWQKDIPDTAPKWLTRWHETGVDGRDRPRCQRPPDRRPRRDPGLARQPGELRDPRLDRAPARAVAAHFAYIDIDPGEKTTWEETLVLARLYRTALGHLGVRGYPKTTGKRGIQIWIPIVPRYGFAETSAWVERVSRAVGATVPDLVSWEWAKERPQGSRPASTTPRTRRIKTLVAPYAVRPAPGAPVSAPDHLGRAGRSGPAARPLDDPRPSSSASPRSATCSPRPRPISRSCPHSERGPLTAGGRRWHDAPMDDDTPPLPPTTPNTEMLPWGTPPSGGPSAGRSTRRLTFKAKGIEGEPHHTLRPGEGEGWGGGCVYLSFGPGRREVGAAAITGIGVSPDHRRRGILTRMMRWLLDQAAERGEPVAVLHASEGAIYPRFGFGLATLQGTFDIDRNHFRFARPAEPLGRVRLVDRDEAMGIIPALYDEVRLTPPRGRSAGAPRNGAPRCCPTAGTTTARSDRSPGRCSRSTAGRGAMPSTG